MLIGVHVIPNAKQAVVTKISETSYEIRVDETALRGRANRRLVEVLSDHFKVSKSRVSIVKGEKSREKIVEIDLA